MSAIAELLAQARENVDHAEALLTRDPFGEAERSLAATLLREALAAIERAEVENLRRLLHGPDRLGQMWKRVEAAEQRADHAKTVREALEQAADKFDVIRRTVSHSKSAPNVWESLADQATWGRDDARAALEATIGKEQA